MKNGMHLVLKILKDALIPLYILFTYIYNLLLNNNIFYGYNGYCLLKDSLGNHYISTVEILTLVRNVLFTYYFL